MDWRPGAGIRFFPDARCVSRCGICGVAYPTGGRVLPTRLGERGHGLAETTDVYGFGKENARFLAAMNTKGTILVVDDEESHRYTRPA